MAFTPAFEDMLDSEHGLTEYAPPPYVTERGVPLLNGDLYAKLRDLCTGLPSIGELPPLTGEEAARCMQWSAPMQVLGVFPEDIDLTESLFVATSEGDLTEICHVLRDALAQTRNMAAAQLVPTPRTATVVTFYLDGPGWTEWQALVKLADGTARLSPAPGLMVVLPCPRPPARTETGR